MKSLSFSLRQRKALPPCLDDEERKGRKSGCLLSHCHLVEDKPASKILSGSRKAQMFLSLSEVDAWNEDSLRTEDFF